MPDDTIEMEDLNPSEKDPLNPPAQNDESQNEQQTLLGLIKDLQEQERVFPHNDAETILKRMELLLKPVINSPLSYIYQEHNHFAELICHTFFGKRTCYKGEQGELYKTIPEAINQLYGVLIGAYISKVMQQSRNEDEAFKANHTFFEETAYEMFDEMYKKNKTKLEYHILAYDYETQFKESTAEEKDKSRELLCVAYRGKCKKFLSHQACQNYINARWEHKNNAKLFEAGNSSDPTPPVVTNGSQPAPQRSNPSGSAATEVLNGSQPAPEASNPTDPAAPAVSHGSQPAQPVQAASAAVSTISMSSTVSKLQQESTWRSAWNFVKSPTAWKAAGVKGWHSFIGSSMWGSGWNYFRSPEMKYCVHGLLNFLFVICFGIVLVMKPYRIGSLENNQVPVVWLAMYWYVMATLTVDLFMQAFKIFFLAWNKQNGWWNFRRTRAIRAVILFIAFIFTFVWLTLANNTRPAFSGVLGGLLEFVYCTAFVLSAVWFLKYFSYIDKLGAHIDLLKKLVFSLLKYMLLLVFFWLIYSVVYLSLTESLMNRNENILWFLFSKGSFETFGEPKDRDRDGIVDKCEDVLLNNITWANMDDVSCLFRSSLLPPVLLIYMFITAVMLINVFTAMLSYEYEKTQEKSKNDINFHRYHLLTSFETKLWLPTPFNFIFIFIIWILKLLQGTWNFIFRCCKITIMDAIDTHKWLKTPKGIGPPGVKMLVNTENIKNFAKETLNKEENHVFAEAAHQYLLTLKRNPDGGIEEAKRILFDVLDIFKNYLGSQSDQAKEMITNSEAIERKHRSTSRLSMDNSTISRALVNAGLTSARPTYPLKTDLPTGSNTLNTPVSSTTELYSPRSRNTSGARPGRSATIFDSPSEAEERNPLHRSPSAHGSMPLYNDPPTNGERPHFT